MNKDELINTLEIAKAEAEWNYPLDCTIGETDITWVNHAEYVKSIMTPVEMPSETVFICGNAESVQELMERI